MDQVKIALRVVAKHSFWLLSGVVVLLSVGSWYMAVGALRADFKKNQDEIEGKYNAVKSLLGKQNPPNEHSHKEMDKLVTDTYQRVVNAWGRQYVRQVDQLRWDEELGEAFIAAVQHLRPIELAVDPPPATTERLNVDHRQLYANYVHRLLPKLAEMIGARWTAKRGAGNIGGGGYDMGGAPGMGEMMPSPDPARMGGQGTGRAKTAPQKPLLVHWNSADQGRLLQTHFDWSRQPPDGAPTTLQLLYAQEDLWVLRAIMEVIRVTNGPIESRHEATVKTIDSIMIGRNAPPRTGMVSRIGSGTGMGGSEMPGYGMYGPGGMTPGMESPAPTSGSATSAPPSTGSAPATAPTMEPGRMMPGMMMPGGTMGPGMQGVSLDPADYRYVDNYYKPVTSQALREAMKANPPDPAKAFLVVAKRMPLRMRLVVDRRKLHRFLAECGNSPLMIEIRQVRINRSAGTGDGGMMGGYGSGEMGGMMPGGYGADGPSAGDGGGLFTGGMRDGGGEGGILGPGYGGYMGGGMGAGMGTGDFKGRLEPSSSTVYDEPVEVYGIIYIYNPVAKEKLGVDSLPPGAAAAGTGPAAPAT